MARKKAIPNKYLTKQDNNRQFVNAKGNKQKDKYIPLYISYMTSDAFMSLTTAERLLLIYMIQETRNPKLIKEGYGVKAFCFNQAVQKKWHTSTGKPFREKREKLIDRGFIRYIENNHHRGVPSIYELCEGWKTWTP